MTDGKPRGAKPLSDRDWLFGSRPRRLLLEHVVRPRTVQPRWSRSQLADLGEVVANGGPDENLAGLVRLGLLMFDGVDRTRSPPAPRPPLAAALHRTLQQLGSADDRLVAGSARKPTAPLDAARRAVAAAERALQRAEPDLSPAVAARVARALQEAQDALMT